VQRTERPDVVFPATHDELALRAWLRAQGADPDGDDLVSGHGWADSMAGDLVLARGATLSARDIATRLGSELDKVVALYHDLGVPLPDVDAPQFTEADAVLVERMRGAGELGLVQGQDLLRVVAGAMERIAEAAVAVYVQGPEEELNRRRASVLECTTSSVQALELALDLGTGLGPVFRHHMCQAIARQRVITDGVTSRELARVAIGFVDLVGSTALQAGLDPAGLGEQVSRFEARAFDVIAAGGGRLVKFIGDEIMVAAVDPAAGVRIVSDLITAFTAAGTQPRGGLVFGEVLFRHGDYYGPVVNLAARLVDEAIPGEALVDASVVAALEGEGPSFEPAGRRMPKGFTEPVAVWSLAPGAGHTP
jgi:adenylate cyclase